MLELHQMIRVLHIVAYPMGFNLLCDLGKSVQNVAALDFYFILGLFSSG